MNHAVDALFEFNKSSVGGHVPNPAFDARSNDILVLDYIPGIGLELANAQRNLLLLFVDSKDNGFNQLALTEHIRGTGNSLGPGEIRNMDQSFNTFLNLHKRAVRDQVCHLAMHCGADRESLFDFVPWVALCLFESERYALFLFVDIEDDNVNFLTDLEKFARVSEPTPCHIGVMKHAVHPIEIDKFSEIGEIFYNSFDRIAQLHRLEEASAFLGSLLLDDLSA